MDKETPPPDATADGNREGQAQVKTDCITRIDTTPTMPTSDKQKEHSRRDYEKHKEKRQQKQKEYKEQQKEKVRQQNKAYRERKKAEETPEQAEARRAYQRQYYHDHKEHLIQCRKERAKVVFETLSGASKSEE